MLEHLFILIFPGRGQQAGVVDLLARRRTLALGLLIKLDEGHPVGQPDIRQRRDSAKGAPDALHEHSFRQKRQILTGRSIVQEQIGNGDDNDWRSAGNLYGWLWISKRGDRRPVPSRIIAEEAMQGSNRVGCWLGDGQEGGEAP